MKLLTLVCAGMLFSAGFACAQQGTTSSATQDTAALEQKIRDLEDRLVALEGQVRVLRRRLRKRQLPRLRALPLRRLARHPQKALRHWRRR